jgi:hypothetical protein
VKQPSDGTALDPENKHPLTNNGKEINTKVKRHPKVKELL